MTLRGYQIRNSVPRKTRSVESTSGCGKRCYITHVRIFKTPNEYIRGDVVSDTRCRIESAENLSVAGPPSTLWAEWKTSSTGALGPTQLTATRLGFGRRAVHRNKKYNNNKSAQSWFRQTRAAAKYFTARGRYLLCSEVVFRIFTPVVLGITGMVRC